MYEILAKYYDDLMGDFDYDAYEKFALENLKISKSVRELGYAQIYIKF